MTDQAEANLPSATGCAALIRGLRGSRAHQLAVEVFLRDHHDGCGRCRRCDRPAPCIARRHAEAVIMAAGEDPASYGEPCPAVRYESSGVIGVSAQPPALSNGVHGCPVGTAPGRGVRRYRVNHLTARAGEASTSNAVPELDAGAARQRSACRTSSDR